MADQTFIHTGFAGQPKASSLRASALAPAWIGGRVRMQANSKSLAERRKG